MTDAGPTDEGDLADGIFGDATYAPGQPIAKAFQPWHRPRKQFVRREQWSSQLKRLYTGRPEEEPLRYLGLPGVDLLDLRYLYDELCRAAGRPMRFLGFNTDAQPGNSAHIELSTSLDEVRRLPNVDPQSDVIPDDFRRIAAEASLAWSRVLDLGPFDVVNIDLCDGLASDRPEREGSIYEAIARLIAFQVRNHRPWLLLLTTRVGRGMFNPDAEGRLVELYQRNILNCPGFVEACADLLEGDPASIDPGDCADQDFLCLMIVALTKWVFALAQSQSANGVELASTHGYRVEPGATCEDLISLAVRFEPLMVVPPDPLAPAAAPAPDECDIAEKIARRASARRDIDDILTDAALYEQLAGETRDLLALARYDVSNFRSWLDE